MGLTAEEVQRKYKVKREDADAFAYRSHQNALRAQTEGCFIDEIVLVTVESASLNGAGFEAHSHRNQSPIRTKVRAPIPLSKRSRN